MKEESHFARPNKGWKRVWTEAKQFFPPPLLLLLVFLLLRFKIRPREIHRMFPSNVTLIFKMKMNPIYEISPAVQNDDGFPTERRWIEFEWYWSPKLFFFSPFLSLIYLMLSVITKLNYDGMNAGRTKYMLNDVKSIQIDRQRDRERGRDRERKKERRQLIIKVSSAAKLHNGPNGNLKIGFELNRDWTRRALKSKSPQDLQHVSIK